MLIHGQGKENMQMVCWGQQLSLYLASQPCLRTQVESARIRCLVDLWWAASSMFISFSSFAGQMPSLCPMLDVFCVPGRPTSAG